MRLAVSKALDYAASAWFVEAQQQIAADRSALTRLFPAATRKCGCSPLWPLDPELIGWTIADAVRALLLVRASTKDVAAVYHYGDAEQRRAVLRALPLLDLGDSAVPLVLHALNSRDTRLISAAVGRYAAEYLPVDPWRQAVLTCLTRGVPLAWVADLETRTDDELIAMVRAFDEGRSAAGRTVPPDIHVILAGRPRAEL